MKHIDNLFAHYLSITNNILRHMFPIQSIESTVSKTNLVQLAVSISLLTKDGGFGEHLTKKKENQASI